MMRRLLLCLLLAVVSYAQTTTPPQNLYSNNDYLDPLWMTVAGATKQGFWAVGPGVGVSDGSFGLYDKLASALRFAIGLDGKFSLNGPINNPGLPLNPDYYGSIAAAYAAGPATGVSIFVPVNRTETVPIVLTAGKPIALTCAQGAKVAWNSSGGLIQVGATALVSNVYLGRCQYFLGASAGGFLQVGDTAHAYDPALTRGNWTIENIDIEGGNQAVAGTFGISLTQVSAAKISNVTVAGVETGILCDRCTVNSWDRVRTQSCRYCFEVRLGDSPAGDGSHFAMTDILPIVGAGFGLKVDNIGEDFTDLFVENSGTWTGVGVRITANGLGAHFTAPAITVTPAGGNTAVKLDDGFCNVHMINPKVALSSAAVTVGTMAAAASCKLYVYGGSAYFAGLLFATPNSAANYSYFGPDDSGDQEIKMVNNTKHVGDFTVTGKVSSTNGSDGHASCWKGTVLSYCTSVVASDGTCTCH